MTDYRFKLASDSNFAELGFSLLKRKSNFGDLLLREAAEQLFDLPKIRRNFAGAIFGGSVISEHYMGMAESLKADGNLLMHACGVRSADFDAQKVSNRVTLAGVRGPISQATTGVTAVGDPGLIAPLALGVWPSVSTAGKHLLIPHFKDESATAPEPLQHRTVDVKRGKSSKNLIAEIAQADFVLAGAMHAGIIAYALGTPFSFYKNEFLDVPMKYQDFSDFYQIPFAFSGNFEQGVNHYLRNEKSYREIDPSSILCLIEPMADYLHPQITNVTDQLSDFLAVRSVVSSVKTRRLAALTGFGV
jgi:hypothetical protein